MSQLLISYKNANIYQRHGIRVLKEVNFHVEEGEFVYIIGRVGSGKSSLLRTLYFELDMDEAEEATVFDYDLLSLRQKDIPSLRRQMGVVFQDFQLLGDRTVYKNLQFVLKATGWKKKEEIDQRIDEVLSDVGLQDKADKMPHELSGGEQQRVAPETAENIIELLRQICQTGTAVVMATHNMPLLDKYPGVVYRCVGGKMEEVTSDFNQIQLVDEPDTDEITVRYSEREEI